MYGLVVPGSTISASDSAQTDKLGQWSLFFQDTLHLTERFALVGGVRYMDYDQIAGRGRPFITNTNVSADKVLPLGGAILKLTDQVSLYASYTQSLKPTSTIAPLTGGVVIGSNIAPEEGTPVGDRRQVRLQQADLRHACALRHRQEERAGFAAAIPRPASLNTAPPAGFARAASNSTSTGRLTDNWSVIGSYGYTDARVTEDPTLVGNAPAERRAQHRIALSGL